MNHQIIIAILLGALCAFLGGERVFLLTTLAQSFLVFLKILVLPYLVFAMINGLTNIQKPYRYLRHGVFLWALFWLGTMLILYFASIIFPLHLPFYPREAKLEQNYLSFSPLQVLLHENIAFILLFTWLFGFCLLKTKLSILSFSQTVLDVLYRILERARPFFVLGIFLLSILAFGSLQRLTEPSAFSYLLSFTLLTVLFTAVFFPLLLVNFCSMTYKDCFRLCFPSLLLALALGNAWLALPFAMQALKKHYAQSKSAQEAVSIVSPLFYCLPNAGNFLFLFLLLLLSVGQLKFSGQMFLLFSSAFTFFPNVQNLAFLLQKLLLPQQALHIYLQIALLAKHLQAAVTMMGVMSLSLLLQQSFEGKLFIERRKMLHFSVYLLLSVSAAASLLWIVV